MSDGRQESDAGEMHMDLTASQEAVFREDSNSIDDQDDNFGDDFVSLEGLENLGEQEMPAWISRREVITYRREASQDRKETFSLS